MTDWVKVFTDFFILFLDTPSENTVLFIWFNRDRGKQLKEIVLQIIIIMPSSQSVFMPISVYFLKGCEITC